jgi:steroid delta-isomerase-like uncharacterized protein
MKTIITLIICSLSLVSALPASPLEDENKVIAKRVFEEVLSKGNFTLADEFYASDFRSHGLYHDASLEENQASLKGWHEAFSEMKVEPQKMVAEGDLVTVYWIGRGKNTGAANGLPATGKSVLSGGITIWRIVNGKIKEEWAAFDQFEMMQQLGLIAQETPQNTLSPQIK